MSCRSCDLKRIYKLFEEKKRREAEAAELAKKQEEEKVRQAAEETAKQYIAMQAVANKENLNVSDEELQTMLEEYATGAGYTTVEEYLGEADREDFREYFMLDKVFQFLLENVADGDTASIVPDDTVIEDATGAEEGSEGARDPARRQQQRRFFKHGVMALHIRERRKNERARRSKTVAARFAAFGDCVHGFACAVSARNKCNFFALSYIK